MSELALNLQGRLALVFENVVPGMEARYLDLALHLDYLQVETQIGPTRKGPGRKRMNRGATFRAFVAKAMWNIEDTRKLRRMLVSDESLRAVCGFQRVDEVPSEVTFSRVFKELAQAGYAEELHATLVREVIGDRLVMEVYRDSTAIVAREKALKKPPKEPKELKKRGRKPGGERAPEPPPKRVDVQMDQSWEQAASELPTACDVGAKKNSKGHNQYWVGYKMHVDVTEHGLPLSVLATSASVHDTQVAIPLMRKTGSRVQALYQLMDAAYVCGAVEEAARRLGQVPIIAPKATPGKPVPELPYDRAERLARRWQVEQFFSWMKERFGARKLLVKGHEKVKFHLMCGVLACFAYVALRL